MIPRQTLPIFPVTIPSTGKKTTFRQFTVREEKILMQAQESEDLQVMVNAIRETIKACVEGVNLDELALFDVEYLITKIRSKSTSEVIELSLPCDADSTHPRIPVHLDLEKAEVVFPEGHNKTIELYEGSGVIMRYPTVDDIANLDGLDRVDAIAMLIESVFTPDEIYRASESTPAEIREYVESLTDAQLTKIKREFIDTMPRFEYTLKYKCFQCGHEHTRLVKGLANFFG